MANKAQIEKFIAQIAPLAIKAYQTLGKVKPSVCIGMACVECGYGTAGSTTYNSYLGQKVGTGKTATKYWTGTFKSWKTKEEYTVGVHTVITDAFRTYPSMEMCVFNYYELLNSKFYARVKADADYRTQMQQIKAVGYMTSSKEVNSVIKIIENNGLTKYDDIANGIAVDIQERPKRMKYEIGKTYTLQKNMYIRESPNGDLVKTVTEDAKKHMDKFPILKKGTRVTCRDVQLSKNGSTWIKCPSGWICAMSYRGTIYIN